MLDTFTVATFADHLGEPFRIHPDAGDPLVAELIAATPFAGAAAGAAPSSGGRAPFSIVFRGPRAPLLPQRIYRIAHDALGSFELFLVPLGPDGVGLRYEAVFA